MATPPTTPRGQMRRRHLNQPLIKSAIVLFAAVLTAIGSAITGIGAQVAFGPMLTWMFGYSVDKAFGTALRYAVFAAGAAFVTTTLLQGEWNRDAVSARILMFVGRGLLLFAGATLGAMLAPPLTPKPKAIGQRRALQSLGIVLSTFVVIEAMHLSAVTRSSLHYAHWDAWWQLGLLGVAAGALTQATGLAGGVVLVPALFFLTGVHDAGAVRGLTSNEAVAISLLVVFCASVLPAWSYGKRGLSDETYLAWAIAGGIIGGAFGGWLLAHLLERSVLLAFGLLAMFLSGRELARLAMESGPPPESESGNQPE